MESPIYQPPRAHRTSPFVWILFIVAILLIAWLVWRALHQTPRTPEAVLKELSSSSLPVSESEEERAAALGAMGKSSTPITKTEAQRLGDLESLRQ